MKKINFILSLIFVVNAVFSQSLKDTIKIKEVEVIAKRPLKNTAKDISKIDSLILLQSQNESMAVVLSEHSPVFIKQAGRGALASVSFRGTSASHTDVVWNDISIKSPMLGQVDFSLLPTFFIDEISILPGGSSLEKSNSALGGVISIDNNINTVKNHKVRFIQAIGSYTTINDYLDILLGKKYFKSRTRLFYNYSKNDFKFKNKNIADIDPETGEYIYPVQKNENADYLKYGLLQEFYLLTNKNFNISLKYWGQFNDRNLPKLNTFEGDDYSNINRQLDKTHRILAKLTKYFSNSKLEYIPAFVYQKMKYSQANYISGVGYQNVVYSISQSKSFYNKLKYNYKFNSNNELNFNLNFNNDNVSAIDTVTNQGYDKIRNELVMFLSYNSQITNRLGASVMVRKYYSDALNMPIAGFVGVDYLINKNYNIYVKSSLSKNFKNPDLNDLYWQPGGNPDLKPEESLSYDFSTDLEKSYTQFYFKSKLSLYYSDVKNWIIWLPSPMGYWTPENIKTVISKGAEFYLKLSFKLKNIKITGIGNYAYTDARNYGKVENWGDESYGKQLPYIPVHSGNFLLKFFYKKYSLTYTNNSYSERYTSSSNNTSLRDWLYPYYMNNLEISRYFNNKKFNLDFSFKIYNLFNEEYRSILGRPMPGINYMFSVKFTLL